MFYTRVCFYFGVSFTSFDLGIMNYRNPEQSSETTLVVCSWSEQKVLMLRNAFCRYSKRTLIRRCVHFVDVLHINGNMKYVHWIEAFVGIKWNLSFFLAFKPSNLGVHHRAGGRAAGQISPVSTSPSIIYWIVISGQVFLILIQWHCVRKTTFNSLCSCYDIIKISKTNFKFLTFSIPVLSTEAASVEPEEAQDLTEQKEKKVEAEGKSNVSMALNLGDARTRVLQNN